MSGVARTCSPADGTDYTFVIAEWWSDFCTPQIPRSLYQTRAAFVYGGGQI